MKGQWTAAILALGLAATLTACGTSDRNDAMTGEAGQARNSGTYGTTAGKASYGKGHTTQRRTAYDYLNDGRYEAGKDGQVDGKTSSAARDYTQDARDLMRDTGEAIGDAGKAVGDAMDRLGGGVRDVTRDVTGQ